MEECYRCFYRSRVTLTCDYILIEGKRRGSSVDRCDKFKQRSSGNLSEKMLEIQKLYYKGYSDRRIAKELEVSRYEIGTWRRANGLPPKGNRGRPKSN